MDANALAWVLLGKLSEKLHIAPEVIYQEMVRDIGGNYEVLPVRADAVERFCEAWKSNGIGWQTTTFPSKLHGYVNVMAYFGSSTYDTAQMSRLINNIIDECHTHGVETRTPEEIESLLKMWEERAK